jgi:hypothetical protein
MKAPAPAMYGTWDTEDKGPHAKKSTWHDPGELEQYFLDVEGFNAAIGPFNPPATDQDYFFIQ